MGLRRASPRGPTMTARAPGLKNSSAAKKESCLEAAILLGRLGEGLQDRLGLGEVVELAR
jgi:hypothetical protein